MKSGQDRWVRGPSNAKELRRSFEAGPGAPGPGSAETGLPCAWEEAAGRTLKLLGGGCAGLSDTHSGHSSDLIVQSGLRTL